MTAVTRLQRVRDLVEVHVARRLLADAERVVEGADRVRRVGDLQDEVGEGAHLLLCQLIVAADQALERRIELEERGDLVERAAVRLHARSVVAAGAIAAPVHRPVVRHAAETLRRHRALHRVEVRVDERTHAEGTWVVQHDVVGVAEVPSEAVEVGEDVAAGARGIAVARREPGIVEKVPAGDDARGLRVVERDVRLLVAGRGAEHRDRVVEARQHVELRAALVEDDARRAAAAHR